MPRFSYSDAKPDPHQLYCGCCKIPVDGMPHFETTGHHLKALDAWCALLADSHNFGKGYVNEPMGHEQRFIAQILTTKLILFNREIEIEKIDEIISSHLSKCVGCHIFLPKDIQKTLWGKRVKSSGKDMCPDCFFGKNGKGGE